MRRLCLLFATVVLLLFGVPTHAEIQTLTGIAAVVHDSVITYQEMELYTAPAAMELRRKHANEPTIYNREVAKAEHETLQQLMNDQIILHEFERAGYKIPDSIIDDVVQERIRSKFSDRATFTKTLQAQGTTFEQFRKQVRNQFIINAMERNFIADGSLISPHKIEVYYADHQDEFQMDDQVKMRMIVLNKSEGENDQIKQVTQEVLKEIDKGVPFEQMASVYSQGSQAQQGGDLGWVEKKILRKELADTAFSLKAGEHSGVLELSDGYYIILVEDTKTAHVRPLKEVRADIEKTLSADERAELQKQWIEKLRKKTFVLTY